MWGRFLEQKTGRNNSGYLDICMDLIYDTPTLGSPFRYYHQYSIALILEGEGIYKDKFSKKISIRPGHLIIVRPNIPHYYAPINRWRTLFLTFRGTIFDAINEQGLFFGKETVLHFQNYKPLAIKMRSIIQSQKTISPQNDLMEVGKLIQWLSEMQNPEQKLTVPLLGLKKTIITEIDKMDRFPLNVRKFRENLGLSQNGLNYRFQMFFGKSPKKVFQEKIVKKASDLLIQCPNHSIRSISEKIGFSSEFNFSKFFKKCLGVSPRYYRQMILSPSYSIKK